ncbi:flavodoxin [Anoxynatronum buryatiense]|uniref:Flavodoxin n=1 Tax=Anoxynatronum buryatiense TaxID=489973 RepID=A0AA45WWV3_9CLOT|nr:flavodoxin [Anoxynatronum buryatiense]SMP61478.1 flavodoxin, short chain [Anoxynatronum buryatiense]
MKKVAVVYWTGSGNTEQMAQAVAEGITAGGGEAVLLNVSDASPEDVWKADAAALGCPSMGAEVLEEGEMEPFVETLVGGELTGKPMALFGSYDWGNGEWMHDWEERMKAAGAQLVDDGLITRLNPDDEALENCRALGKRLAG